VIFFWALETETLARKVEITNRSSTERGLPRNSLDATTLLAPTLLPPIADQRMPTGAANDIHVSCKKALEAGAGTIGGTGAVSRDCFQDQSFPSRAHGLTEARADVPQLVR